MVIALRRRLTSLLSVFAAIGLVLMMSHIVINAILRFSFNSPISGTNEIVEYWYLPFVALVGIPAAQLNREQISVNILTERMSKATARIFAWFVMAIAVIFSLGAAWFGLQAALGQASINATGGVTNILVWPAYFLVPITFTLLGIIFIADMTNARPESGAGSAVVGSPSLNDLPLAYQQIIYDSMSDYFRGAIIGSVDVGAHVVEQIKDIDGSFEELSPEVQELIADFNSTAAENTANEGALDSDVYANLNEAYSDWADQVSDFGYEDDGPLEDMDEWHEGEGIDYAPIADTYYENSALELRPEG